MAGRPESRPRASRSLFFVVFFAELTSVGVVLYVENALAKFVVLREQCLKGRLWVDALSRYFGIVGHFGLGIPLFSLVFSLLHDSGFRFGRECRQIAVTQLLGQLIADFIELFPELLVQLYELAALLLGKMAEALLSEMELSVFE